VCILLLVVGCTRGAALAQEWECQKCPTRSVAVFAVSIPDPSSDATLMTGEYVAMQMAGDRILHHLLNEDPSRECIFFISAAFAGEEDAGENGYSVGSGLAQLPSGSVTGADYLVSGEIVADDDGNYVLNVRLEAGGTREEVASGSVAYDLAADPAVNTSRAAWRLMPLMG